MAIAANMKSARNAKEEKSDGVVKRESIKW
jgi:hypothetical protein